MTSSITKDYHNYYRERDFLFKYVYTTEIITSIGHTPIIRFPDIFTGLDSTEMRPIMMQYNAEKINRLMENYP
jgi:hypothetical protein